MFATRSSCDLLLLSLVEKKPQKKTKTKKNQEKRWTKGHRRQGQGETKPKKHTSRKAEGKVKFKNTRAPARAQTRQEGALVRIGGG